MFGSTTPNNPTIYIAPETVITGIDNVHFSNHSSEANSTNVNAASKAIIYISPNTIFTAPEEVMRLVVVITNPKTKTVAKQIKFTPQTKITISGSTTTVCDKNIPNPFQRVPYRNADKSNFSTTSVTASFSKSNAVVAANFPTAAFDFLNLRKLPQSQLFLQPTDFALNTYQSDLTSRPPPYI